MTLGLKQPQQAGQKAQAILVRAKRAALDELYGLGSSGATEVGGHVGEWGGVCVSLSCL